MHNTHQMCCKGLVIFKLQQTPIQSYLKSDTMKDLKEIVSLIGIEYI